MITIYIFAGLGAVILLIGSLMDSCNYIFPEHILATLSGAFLGGFIGFLIALILPVQTETQTKTYTIEVLQDNNSVTGGFFLGSGIIDGKMQYVMYLHRSDSSYTLEHTPADKTTVRYADKPVLYVKELAKTDAWYNSFGLDTDIGSQTYVIEVPQGTIKQNFNLDAQ